VRQIQLRTPRLLRTASFRLAALYLLLFTASAIILGAVVFWTTRAAVDQQLDSRIETELRFLADEFSTGGLPQLLADVTRRSRGPGALEYLVQAPDGTRLGGEIPGIGGRRGWIRLIIEEADAKDGREKLRALAVALPGGIVVAVGDDTRRAGEAEEAVLRAFAWAIGATLLLGMGGGAWLSHHFLHRVDMISRTAEAIIRGDLARRVPLRGTGDDLDRLAETLNRMLDRISELMESVRQVSNDIAHDLRTPLSRLGQRLEDARAHAGLVADYERALEGAKTDVEALLGIFAALLRIAEVEAGAQRAAFQRVDLSSVVEVVAQAFAPAAEDEGRNLAAEVAPGITVCGDRELLTQALANLVENALRHTASGSHVRLLLGKQGGRAVLVVEDDGPGVPESERERILRRFYRREQSRTTPGSGLGLSLVAAVAALHRADLRLADACPGLRVSLSFACIYQSGFSQTGNTH
jgi:signal transduction histidine kinase